jgi:hypothetical protein
MSAWNYRLLKSEAGYRIIEVYYDHAGKIVAWCEARPCGESAREVAADLELMQQAVDRPTLTYADLPKEE